MTKRGMPDAIIFDLDGTTTKAGILSLVVDFFDAEQGVLRAIKAAHTTYETLKRAKKATIPLDLKTGAVKRRLVHLCAPPQNDLPHLMSLAQAADIKLGLLSNNSRHAWGDRLMRHVNYSLAFDHTMYSEDVGPHAKPSPRGLLQMIDTLVPQAQTADQVKNIWFVGDAKSDMLAAINAMQETPHTITPVALGANSSAAKFLEEYAKTDGAQQAITCKSIEDLGLHIMIAESFQLVGWEDINKMIQPDRIITLPAEDFPSHWSGEDTDIKGIPFGLDKC